MKDKDENVKMKAFTIRIPMSIYNVLMEKKDYRSLNLFINKILVEWIKSKAVQQ